MSTDQRGPIPADLTAALKAAAAFDAFDALPPSHRREHINAIDEAKKPETRARRIENCVKMVAAKTKARK